MTNFTDPYGHSEADIAAIESFFGPSLFALNRDIDPVRLMGLSAACDATEAGAELPETLFKTDPEVLAYVLRRLDIPKLETPEDILLPKVQEGLTRALARAKEGQMPEVSMYVRCCETAVLMAKLRGA